MQKSYIIEIKKPQICWSFNIKSNRAITMCSLPDRHFVTNPRLCPRKKHAFIGRHLGFGQVWACLLELSFQVIYSSLVYVHWRTWVVHALEGIFVHVIWQVVWFASSQSTLKFKSVGWHWLLVPALKFCLVKALSH
jgi:hypothetical protein